jgi:two-component system sensor histidine kinase ChvG
MKQKKSASILKKFLLFNLTVFSILGLFTIIYLEAIQPTLVSDRSSNHKVVINNTKENLERLNIEYTKKGIREFLLSTRFLFQSLDRVQFYDLLGNLIGDTNILDLDQSVFSRSEIIFEEILGEDVITPEIEERLEEEQKDEIKDIIMNKYDEEIMTFTDDEKNNFIVSTLSKIKFQERDIGYIVVS